MSPSYALYLSVYLIYIYMPYSFFFARQFSYGYVYFRSIDSVTSARQLNGQRLDGRPIKIDLAAKPKRNGMDLLHCLL